MINVDMVRFKCEGEGKVEDLYSTGYRMPYEDTTNDYFGTEITYSDGYYKFITYRKFDTGDSAEDMVVECGKSYTMAWAANIGTSDFIRHNRKKEWVLDIPEDCGASLVGTPEMMPELNLSSHLALTILATAASIAVFVV